MSDQQDHALLEFCAGSHWSHDRASNSKRCQKSRTTARVIPKDNKNRNNKMTLLRFRVTRENLIFKREWSEVNSTRGWIWNENDLMTSINEIQRVNFICKETNMINLDKYEKPTWIKVYIEEREKWTNVHFKFQNVHFSIRPSLSLSTSNIF